MKPQDIIFVMIVIVAIFLYYKIHKNIFALLGIFFILIAIPLFLMQVFFTAERLVIYAFILFFIATLFGFRPRP